MDILKSRKNNKKENKNQEKGLHFAPQISSHAGWEHEGIFLTICCLRGLVWCHTQ
jgi:hypothetical protein